MCNQVSVYLVNSVFFPQMAVQQFVLVHIHVNETMKTLRIHLKCQQPLKERGFVFLKAT